MIVNDSWKSFPYCGSCESGRLSLGGEWEKGFLLDRVDFWFATRGLALGTADCSICQSLGVHSEGVSSEWRCLSQDYAYFCTASSIASVSASKVPLVWSCWIYLAQAEILQHKQHLKTAHVSKSCGEYVISSCFAVSTVVAGKIASWKSARLSSVGVWVGIRCPILFSGYRQVTSRQCTDLMDE